MRSVRELMDLRGRVSLVTGAAGGIGSMAAETLAELGSHVVAVDIDEAGVARLAEQLAETWDVPAVGLCSDVSKRSDVAHAVETARTEFGRLDILVHAAALVGTSELDGWTVPFDAQSEATWRLALDVNLTSLFLLAQEAHESLAGHGQGVVLAFSSIYGLVGPDLRIYEGTGMGNPAAYAASKGGLVQLVRWLSTVLAPEIRVNSLSPGGVSRNQPEEFVRRYEDRVPMGRMATEEDLRGAVAYLCSDLSRYVTGQNLVVDGGWTSW